MVKFSVFNELSLPLRDISEFNSFFVVLAELRKAGLEQIRMDKPFTHYTEILPNTSLQQLLGQVTNRDQKRRLLSFINNGITVIESPLIKDEEEEREGLLENEYFYNGNSTIGALACCDIWQSIAVSFNSHEIWNQPFIEIERQNILEEYSKTITIRNVSECHHLESHQDFFERLEHCIRSEITIANFWSRKHELFDKKIVLCKEVEKEIKNMDVKIFYQALSILRDIDNGTKCLDDFTISRESQSVGQDKSLRKLREFEIDGVREYFQNHIKNLSNGYRIHYFEKHQKIYIGYIGKHLPTKKFD